MKFRSTKVDAGEFKHELLNRLRSTMAVNVLITNYGIIIKSISTLMYTVWHVDKYKIIFKLVVNRTNEIL